MYDFDDIVGDDPLLLIGWLVGWQSIRVKNMSEIAVHRFSLTFFSTRSRLAFGRFRSSSRYI